MSISGLLNWNAYILVKTIRLFPHKVNESGSSSKEVGDIDIFDSEGTLVNAIEVRTRISQSRMLFMLFQNSARLI